MTQKTFKIGARVRSRPFTTPASLSNVTGTVVESPKSWSNTPTIVAVRVDQASYSSLPYGFTADELDEIVEEARPQDAPIEEDKDAIIEKLTEDVEYWKARAQGDKNRIKELEGNLNAATASYRVQSGHAGGGRGVYYFNDNESATEFYRTAPTPKFFDVRDDTRWHQTKARWA